MLINIFDLNKKSHDFFKKVMIFASPGWMTIEYLKCRKDLNFDVDFRVNGVIGTIVNKWDVILFG